LQTSTPKSENPYEIGAFYLLNKDFAAP
jgi:hypothetical protein